MTAAALRLSLLKAGLHIREEPGWRTRGNLWNINAKPEGVMQHHTAPPNPYPISKLYGPPFYRTKCNMATHEDGTLYLVAYKACNYSSGYGMLPVLTDNVRPSVAPTHNARKRGLKSGNRHFWNYENSHPGDGSPIPQVQLDTIIESTRVVLEHFELDPEQVISHAEWTSRKIDPRWNGSNRTAIEQIRKAVREMLTEDDLTRIGQVVDERIAAAFGPITIPGEPNRATFQTMVNAWHAYSDGRKLFVTLDAAHDYAKTAAETSGASDVADEFAARLTD